MKNPRNSDIYQNHEKWYLGIKVLSQYDFNLLILLINSPCEQLMGLNKVKIPTFFIVHM